MIERLTYPNQKNFTAIEGRQPYFSKFNTPINIIQYADVVTNVLSNGCNVSWYYDPPQIAPDYIHTAYSGIAPMIKMWWGGGIPEVMQPVNPYTGANTKSFGIKFSGKFRCPVGGRYQFYIAGEGDRGYFNINSATTNGHETVFWGIPESANWGLLSINNSSYKQTPPTPMNGGYWYDFILYSRHNLGDNYNNGIMALWRPVGANWWTCPEKTVISAFNLSTPGFPGMISTMPAEFSTVTAYNSTKLNISDGAISEFSFKVPFIDTTNAFNYKGYYYDPNTDSYNLWVNR